MGYRIQKWSTKSQEIEWSDHRGLAKHWHAVCELITVIYDLAACRRKDGFVTSDGEKTDEIVYCSYTSDRQCRVRLGEGCGGSVLWRRVLCAARVLRAASLLLRSGAAVLPKLSAVLFGVGTAFPVHLPKPGS